MSETWIEILRRHTIASCAETCRRFPFSSRLKRKLVCQCSVILRVHRWRLHSERPQWNIRIWHSVYVALCIRAPHVYPPSVGIRIRNVTGVDSYLFKTNCRSDDNCLPHGLRGVEAFCRRPWLYLETPASVFGVSCSGRRWLDLSQLDAPLPTAKAECNTSRTLLRRNSSGCDSSSSSATCSSSNTSARRVPLIVI